MKIIKKLMLCVVLVSCATSFSQKKEIANVSLDDILSETQKTSEAPEGIEMLWWMPTEYWNVVFSNDESISNKDKKEIINLLKDYVIIIAVKGKIGLFGGITYVKRENIIRELKTYYNGSTLKLLSEDDLEPDIKNFISAIAPMMKNMLGQMGENMQVFIYKNDKKQPIDVFGNGNFEMELGDFKTKIEFPLASLLLEKKCPEDQKLYNGKWSFCPYHGKELIKQ